MSAIVFRVDDLSGEPTQALVKRHLAGMHENSPPESVHALDLDKLRDQIIVCAQHARHIRCTLAILV